MSDKDQIKEALKELIDVQVYTTAMLMVILGEQSHQEIQDKLFKIKRGLNETDES